MEVTTKKIVEILETQKDQDFKANFTGAWDRYHCNKASIITINRGDGFEQAVKVEGGPVALNDEYFIYMAPFTIEQEPTDQIMLLFYCDNALFVKEGKQ